MNTIIGLVVALLIAWGIAKSMEFFAENTVSVHGKTISLKHYQDIKHATIEYIRAKQKDKFCKISLYLSDDDTWLLSDLMLYEGRFIRDLEKETGIEAKKIIQLLRP